ncbi:glycoside hydrolase family 18 protein [Paenibacillus pasadenensis]|uniref:chitinase n=1 Tax=Paenibacillus pasadenensis TaxID=217090 RepID=A0A482EWG0_9BACL|nr:MULTISPECIES: glycoside hydrolase family 18 protein [Paenibacillus]QBN20710.1 chitinase [Paenibacillus pasadenensis]QGG58253.1 chitinase [Paenibacillus sp. B01]
MTRSYIRAGYVNDHHLPLLTDRDLAQLTHLNLAFAHVREDAIQTSHLRHVDALLRIRSSYPQLKLLLSVGGWSAGGFSEAASTAEGRARMAASALQALEQLPLDGIDLDWEYPSYSVAGIAGHRDDKRTFTLLLRELREALDAKSRADGRTYLLTIAAGADQYYLDGTDMGEVHPLLDFIQLMTYDMRGGFQVLTGHHTNLFTPPGDLFRISADASARLFEAAGVPREKLVLGAAFYSRLWRGVPDRQQGLHQMAATTGGYGPDFTELDEAYIGKNGFERYWDEDAQAPYLFDGQTFISYDDEQSIAAKCAYIAERGLGGLMFWEYGLDRTGRLIAAMARGLGG